MNKLFRMLSLLLAVSMLMSIGLGFAAAEEVIDAGLTCTITLGNWPPDTAPQAEKDLFEGYKATMAKQYPNVTLVPDYYSYSLSNYVPMAKGGTAPSIFQPPFTDPQLLISQHLVGDVTDALEKFGVLEQFSPSYVEMLADENGRIFGLPRDGYVLGMHINIALFREAGLVDEEGLPLYPKTLQELAEYGKIIHEKTGKAVWSSLPARPTAAGCSRTSPGTSAALATAPLNIRMKTAAGSATSPLPNALPPWNTCATCSGHMTYTTPMPPLPTGPAPTPCWARAKLP